MRDSSEIKAALTALAQHLATRRDAILRGWQRSIELDPELTSSSSLSRSRSVDSLRVLLSDLIDLARLEAGEEQRHLAPFDAAALLREFCESVRPLAEQRGLFLETSGPQTLPVAGDAVKVQRIAQNLILNALNITRRGGVRVLWSERSVSSLQQWLLTVQDTGPGFRSQSSAAPLERALREATAEAHQAETPADQAPTLESQTEPGSAGHGGGEGIGLSIVKRLCELLDAGLELESSPGSGATFRVVFPRAYPQPPR